MNRMLIFTVVAIIALVLVGGFGLGVGYFSARSDSSWLKWLKADPPAARSLGPTVSELEEMGELVVTKVHVADVLEAEGLGHRGLWLVRGEALIAVNMAEAELTDKDDAKQSATIRLPAPSVISARVDHEKTKTYDFESTTWLPWRKGDQGALRDNAMLHAQRLVEHSAQQNVGFDYARQTCELLLHNIYQQVSWDVQVEWQDENVTNLDKATPADVAAAPPDR